MPDATATLAANEVGTLMRAALDEARRLDLRVVVAVVDRAGNLAGLLRDPDAFLTSTSIAIAKAFTASNFGEPTAALAERIPADVRTDIARVDGRLTFIRGGLPITRDGVAVGGIGVSGATAQQDEAVAAAALAEVA